MGNTVKQFNELTEDDIVYLAGVFSGAGSFGLKRFKGREVPFIAIRMKNESLVRNIAKLFSTRICVLQGDSTNSRYKTELTGRNAENIMKMIFPHMDEENKRKILNILHN